MFKKVLLSVFFVLLCLGTPSAVHAADANCKNIDSTANQNDHFSIFNVLNVEDCQESVNGSTTLNSTLKNDAEKAGGPGSLAAAIIFRIINLLLLTIGTVAFLTIFYAGFLFVTANGDEGKLDKGKSILTQSLIGLTLAFLAYYIVTFVQSFFY